MASSGFDSGSVVYVPPNAAEWRHIATNPALTAIITSAGEKAKVIAEGLAADFRDTGHYAAGFDVTVSVERPNGLSSRVVATLANDVRYAAVVELRHHVLARTRDMLRIT